MGCFHPVRMGSFRQECHERGSHLAVQALTSGSYESLCGWKVATVRVQLTAGVLFILPSRVETRVLLCCVDVEWLILESSALFPVAIIFGEGHTSPPSLSIHQSRAPLEVSSCSMTVSPNNVLFVVDCLVSFTCNKTRYTWMKDIDWDFEYLAHFCVSFVGPST